MYKEIFSFSELFAYEDIFQSNRCIFFFDVQGVIIRNNNYHEALHHKRYEDRLRLLCAQQKENYIKITKFGRFFKSKLTEELLLLFLHNLHDFGVELCLLTFARYSADREKALKNHKVLSFFHRQIWAGGIDKGLLMVEYLKTKINDEEKIEKIFFVDDKKEHLNSVKKALDGYLSTHKFLNIKYELFSYQKYPVYPVSEIEFVTFWNKVIQSYKKNKVKKSIPEVAVK